MNAATMHCPVLPKRRRLARPGSVLSLQPLLDIMGGSDGLYLYYNLPGVRLENIALEFDSGVLSLQATARLAPLAGKIHALEFSDIEYESRLRVPAMIDVKRIAASLSNGSLRVFLPFPDKSAPIRIPVSQG